MMLGDEGNMKTVDEVDRIVGLMHEAKKMVSRCIYLNVVKSTNDQEVLQKFITAGGWDILNTWLQEAKVEDNHPLLTEILKVYHLMPVSVDLLKQNSCAKTIKQLTRLEDEMIKNLAGNIVDDWMKAIKVKDKNESDKHKKSKKHRSHHKSSSSSSSKPADEDKKAEEEAPNSPDSVSTSSNSSEQASDFVTLKSSTSKLSNSTKPTTVKIVNRSARSTGNYGEYSSSVNKWRIPC